VRDFVRYRLVTTTNRFGRSSEHVSSVVLAREDVQPSLEVEAEMHEAAGWTVERLERTGEGLFAVIVHRAGRARTIEARAFSPMDDAA
jgi:hypothetical protein